jgi:hypothetical protein
MKRPRKGFRAIKLYVNFTPEGPVNADSRKFLELWAEAQDQIFRMRSKKLREKERDLAQFEDVFDKLLPLMTSALSGKLKPNDVYAEVESLVPDKEMRRRVCDQFISWCNDPPPHTEEIQAETAEKMASLQRSEKHLKTVSRVQTGLVSLWSAALDGDEEASGHLVDVANFACGMVDGAEAKHPEVFEKIARMSTRWPCVAKSEKGWEIAEVKRIDKLKLGSSLRVFHPRFRQARGTEKNLPARRWAKAAVRTVEETRLRQFMYGRLAEDFESGSEFADFMMELGSYPEDEPSWVNEALKIPSFSRESLPQWRILIRQLIRDQLPDFHVYPDWQTQRNTAEASGRDTKGELQNAILDDIVSALEKVAPD